MYTAHKRHSALSWGLPFRTTPRPDGSMAMDDRMAGAFLYSLSTSSAATGYVVAMSVFVPGFSHADVFVPGFSHAEEFVPGFAAVGANS